MMRLTGFAAAVGSAVALVGFAGAANASATIDLIWTDTGTNEIGGVNSSSAIILQVILTAGPGGSAGGAVSVDYSAALTKLVVRGYASTPGGALPFGFGTTINTGSRIENINSTAFPPSFGTGLLAGQSHQLGTVSFHKSGFINGTFEIRSDANAANDNVLDLNGADITATTTFNSAFLINAHPEPDFDRDGIIDHLDNCSERANPAQDDTDGDDCGNLCDADYDQTGRVGFSDWGEWTRNFGTTNELYMHYEPIDAVGRVVGHADFGFITSNFGSVPGPSGTTAGTTACP